MPATALYARLTRQDDTSSSIENQVAAFEELRARHGWEASHYVETGRHASGEWAPAKRPALYRLLADVEAGVVTRVVVRHLDRLGRGAILLTILDTLAEHGVDLWTFAGPEDYRTAAGELGAGVQAVVGRFEVRRTGERIRASRRGHWQRGVYIGPAPYGYTSQARIRGELLAEGLDPVAATVEAQRRVPVAPGLVVDPDEADVLRRIFALYLEGYGVRAIATTLTRSGSTKRGRPWSPQAVGKLLRDPKPAGLVHFDDEAFRASTRRSVRPRHRQALRPAQHEAIITREEWDSVQAQLDARGLQVKGSKARARLYPLTGVAYCAHGHPMRGGSSGPTEGGSWAYYRCVQRATRGPSACDAPAIRAEIAETLALAALRAILASPEAAVTAANDVRAIARRAAPANREAERRIVADIAALEMQREGLLNAFRTPGLDPAAVATALGEVQRVNERLAELAVAREAAAAAARPVHQPAVTVDAVREGLGQLLACLPSTPGRLRVLLEMLRRDQSLRVDVSTSSEVKVSLDISTVVGVSLPVVLTEAASEPEQSAEEWAVAEQGRHICACGCGQPITIRPDMRAATRGVPTFIHGHHRMRSQMEADRRAEAGLVSLNAAAKALGMGASTLSRAVAAGVVTPHGRGWHGALTFRVDDLPALKAALVAAGHHFDGGPLLTTPEMAKAVGIRPRALADLTEALEAKGIVVLRDGAGRRSWRRADVATVRRLVRATGRGRRRRKSA